MLNLSFGHVSRLSAIDVLSLLIIAFSLADVTRQSHTHMAAPILEYRWLSTGGGGGVGGDGGGAPGSNVDVHGAFRVTFNTAADNTAVRISHLAISWSVALRPPRARACAPSDAAPRVTLSSPVSPHGRSPAAHQRTQHYSD